MPSVIPALPQAEAFAVPAASAVATACPVPAHAGNVLGVGVDMVDVARIRGLVERHGDAFLEKVFTETEREWCMALAVPWPSLAARFAAKEAVSKAFGTGIGAELGWRSIGVCRDAAGAPVVAFDAKGERLLRARGARRVLLSLTHTSTLAQATALLVA